MGPRECILQLTTYHSQVLTNLHFLCLLLRSLFLFLWRSIGVESSIFRGVRVERFHSSFFFLSSLFFTFEDSSLQCCFSSCWWVYFTWIGAWRPFLHFFVFFFLIFTASILVTSIDFNLLFTLVMATALGLKNGLSCFIHSFFLVSSFCLIDLVRMGWGREWVREEGGWMSIGYIQGGGGEV